MCNKMSYPFYYARVSSASLSNKLNYLLNISIQNFYYHLYLYRSTSTWTCFNLLCIIKFTRYWCVQTSMLSKYSRNRHYTKFRFNYQFLTKWNFFVKFGIQNNFRSLIQVNSSYQAMTVKCALWRLYFETVEFGLSLSALFQTTDNYALPVWMWDYEITCKRQQNRKSYSI